MSAIPSKRETILKAARTIFVRSGYRGASMDAIAEEAPVSKPTLYSHFGNKHDLFIAVIQTQCSSLVGSMDRAKTLGLPPETGIRAIAESFVQTIFNPESLALYRLIIAEHHHCPELAQLMDQTVIQPNLDLLSAYLRSLNDSGALTIPDPGASGQLLLGMLKGIPHFRCLTGVNDRLSPEEAQRLIDFAVHHFLRGHALA
jgi:TetR/AcrR family transcriptional repressor of mexJK operon